MKLCIGTITKDREDLLRALLDSYAKASRPGAAEIVFVIVENTAAPTLTSLIEEFRDRVAPIPVIYANQATPGIPAARNRVLDIALAEDCDYLTFVDDDETVDRKWLTRITGHIVDNQLDLVGGPVLARQPEARLTRWQRIMFDMVDLRYKGRAELREKMWKRGEQDKVGIFTNNWVIRLGFCRETGLRFDEALGLSGGSDKRLWEDGRALGAKTGISFDAIVYETVLKDRLSLRYQFRRSRDQSLAAYQISRELGHNVKSGPKMVVSVLVRLVRSLLYMIASPLKPARFLGKATWLAGHATGQVYAVLGWNTRHYAE